MVVFFAIVGGMFIAGIGACLLGLAYKNIKETREQRLYWWEFKKLITQLLELRNEVESVEAQEQIDQIIINLKTWGRI